MLDGWIPGLQKLLLQLLPPLGVGSASNTHKWCCRQPDGSLLSSSVAKAVHKQCALA